MITDLKEPTFSELTEYLKVLSEGYVKPDLSKDGTKSASGVVRETKKYFPYIDAVNEELCKRAGIKQNEIERIDINKY